MLLPLFYKEFPFASPKLNKPFEKAEKRGQFSIPPEPPTKVRLNCIQVIALWYLGLVTWVRYMLTRRQVREIENQEKEVVARAAAEKKAEQALDPGAAIAAARPALAADDGKLRADFGPSRSMTAPASPRTSRGRAFGELWPRGCRRPIRGSGFVRSCRRAPLTATGLRSDPAVRGGARGARRNSPWFWCCLLYTSPSPRDGLLSRMPSSA